MAMSRSIRRNGAHPTEKWDGPQNSHEQDSHEQAYHSILLVTVIVIVLRSRDGASAQEGRGASQRLRATWLHLRGIQCDERDAPQCFLCQPTSRNNSAREGSTAGALASKLNLRNISLAALKECTHNPSFSGGDGFMMKQDDEWLLQSWDFHHSIKRLQKTTTPTPCSQNNRTRLRI